MLLYFTIFCYIILYFILLCYIVVCIYINIIFLYFIYIYIYYVSYMDIYCIFHLHIRYTIGMPIWDASQLRQVQVKIHQEIERNLKTQLRI